MLDHTDTLDPTHAEVIDVIKEINRAWLASRWDDLALLLAPDVVARGVAPEEGAVGREACIASYRDFVSQARIGWFEDRDWQVDLNSDVAIVSYRFELAYEMHGQMQSEGGREIWLLRRDAIGWTGFWRTIAQGEGD